MVKKTAVRAASMCDMVGATTRPRTRAAWIVLLLAVPSGVTGCGEDEPASGNSDVSDAAVIDYHYGDASVAPQFHRSYGLTITATSAHVVVDSYGDVLADETFDLDPETWDLMLARLDDLAAIRVDDGEDCAGGTSRSFTVTDGDETVLELDFAVCGDVNTAAGEALDAAIAHVTEQIAGWSDLVSGSG
jgi:hypothetical protein